MRLTAARAALLASISLALVVGQVGLARAALTQDQESRVGVSPPPGATAPQSLAFVDAQGRPTTLGAALGGKPAVLIFADYRCSNLCGPALVLTRAGLEKSGLKPGRDYRLVVVGLNPAETPADARSMEQREIGPDPEIANAASFLSGTPASVAAATRAFGYRYVWDPQYKQFGHLADALVLSPRGRLVRVLSEIGLASGDLHLALVDASHGRLGSLGDQIHLLCYGFNTASGVYNSRVAELLHWAAALTLVAMAGGVGALIWRQRSRARRTA
jgi:protein SCO1/2